MAAWGSGGSEVFHMDLAAKTMAAWGLGDGREEGDGSLGLRNGREMGNGEGECGV